ncbi:(R)-mandelonitrile lyase-like [Aristolochia californica]|uniref:(R)-mandelonitrile lyase-like n=1 Tax=Aristolochia californica TaxID=171875 RepID=UPI0035DEA4A9
MPRSMPPFGLLFAVHFLLLPMWCFSHYRREPAYFKFAHNATDIPMEEEYDYIVVGGGTAGCPLAATLSEKFSVLLLERGGVGENHPNLMTQGGFLSTLMQTDRYESPAQAFISDDGVPNARGRVLGGSSAINAGFYSRAEDEFFNSTDPIVWNMELVNQSYEWVEKAIVFRPALRRWQSAVRDSLLDAHVTPYNGYMVEHRVGTKIGGSLFDRAGRRHSAADLLKYAKKSNIKVVLHASVERVLLAEVAVDPMGRTAGTTGGGGDGSTRGELKPSAIGVIYRDKKGQLHHAMVREKGEVILSAGALGSPQLLLLSGVGRRSYLSSLGIPTAYDSPFVGQFLYDNPRSSVSFLSPVPLEAALIQVVGITNDGTYIEAASNLLPMFRASGFGFFPPSSPIYLHVASLMEKVVGPLSFGDLRLVSTDVRDNPAVRFNYFSHPLDLSRCMAGVRKIGEVLKSRCMDEFKFPMGRRGEKYFRYVGPPPPPDLANEAAVADFCQRTVTTIWHYHGGCVAGKVVDGEFRVIGVGALRVVDGSTFSVSPGTNPQATLMMLGRYVGRRLIRRKKASDRNSLSQLRI